MNLARCAPGHTLIDLLLCGTIVACLSAVALPSYHRTVLKDRRALARNTLVDLAALQEDHRRAHRTFARDIRSLVGAQASTRYYRFEILDAAHADTCGPVDPEWSGTPVALSATATGPQAGDRSCRQLILCFDGRPGAKAAFDDQRRSTPSIRNTCWGLQES